MVDNPLKPQTRVPRLQHLKASMVRSSNVSIHAFGAGTGVVATLRAVMHRKTYRQKTLAQLGIEINDE